MTNIPHGFQIGSFSNVYLTIEKYGGDARGKPTVMCRCFCKEDGTMISDHGWFDGADALKIINLGPTDDSPIAMENNRPKRGTKLRVTGSINFYGDGTKTKLSNLVNVTPLPFIKGNKQTPYWDPVNGRREKTSFWHNQ